MFSTLPRAIYATPQDQGRRAPAAPKSGSVFVRRTSLFPSKEDKRPMAVHMFNFYRELKRVCSLKPPTECHCVGGSPESVVDEEQIAGLAWLQSLAQEGNLEELQFQLFMREIQRLNPNLEDGCLFVDGLYQLVASRTPLEMDAKPNPSLKGSVRDLLTMHKSGNLLLQTYWRRPDDPEDHAAYLAVASSFVQFVLSKYGSEGVSQFLRKLDCSMTDPQAENFRFKRKDILKLEVKWKKFAEAAVNEKFRLSTFGMLRMLLRKYLLTYWFRLMVVLLIVFADVALHLFFAIASGRLLSFGFTPSNVLLIVQWIGTLLGIILVRFMLMLMSTILLASVAVNVSNKLRKQLSMRLHAVTPKFLADHSASSILSTFMQDVNSIEMVVAFALRTVIWGLLMLATCIIYTVVIVWPLGIPLAFVFVTTQLIVHFVSVQLSDHSFAKSQATNKLCDILKEEIDGFTINKTYKLGNFWQLEMNNVIRTHYKLKAMKSLFLTKFVQLFQGLVPNIVGSLLTFAIILLVQNERITFENGLVIFVFFTTVVIALTSASVVFPHIQTAATALGRINALLNNNLHDLEEDHREKVVPQNKNLLSQNEHSLSVEFKNVCFSYGATASHWNLFNITLKIAAGERVAVVGRSGAGKTTFLNLVLQMFKPTCGEVVIGGEEYVGIKVAATFQSNHIFGMSIQENIRIGNLKATDEDVEESAKQADIHNWIMSLPRGYDTAVHAGGGSLSGGQKQRIAVARMLVANAPVLVLDEVTSALDPATETRVFEKLMEVTAGRTVIAATHRLAQAKQFDRIVVFSHGKIKEMGSHEGLCALQGTYWCMWNNENSPENNQKAVPIIRRRSLKVELPDLSIVPLSGRVTPASLCSEKPVQATPTFTPLLTLQETSVEHDNSAQSAKTTVIQKPTGNSFPEGLGISIPVPVKSSTPLPNNDQLKTKEPQLHPQPSSHLPPSHLPPSHSLPSLPPSSRHPAYPLTPVVVVVHNEHENVEAPVVH